MSSCPECSNNPFYNWKIFSFSDSIYRIHFFLSLSRSSPYTHEKRDARSLCRINPYNEDLLHSMYISFFFLFFLEQLHSNYSPLSRSEDEAAAAAAREKLHKVFREPNQHLSGWGTDFYNLLFHLSPPPTHPHSHVLKQPSTVKV